MRCIRGTRERSSSSLAEFKMAVRYAMHQGDKGEEQ